MFGTKGLTLLALFFSPAASLLVSITPSQGEISVGESKFFLCEVVGGAKVIDWYSPTGEKIEASRLDITVGRSDETSSTLTIYNATVDSAGTYKCAASNGGEESETTVNVKIYQKITFKHTPSPQEFNEGQNANIVCDVASSPPPSVIWKYKGAKIHVEKDVRFKVLDNNHLQIHGIRKSDEGTYTCEARIMARGEIDLRPIQVIVNVAPSIRIRVSEVNSTADMGHSTMLACDPDGYPEPTVTWTRNSMLLEAGEKYSFNDDGSEMIVRDVTKLDEGDYTCIAKNKAGEHEEELSLRVFMKPNITYMENKTTTEMTEQITLLCDASGDPTPSITWSFGQRVFTEGEQAHLNRIYQSSWTRPEQHKSSDGNVLVRSDSRVSSLTLKLPQYTDAGQYLCTARNAIGQDAKFVHLEVRYTPKIQGSVTVYTWEGNPVNISCHVVAHPSDVVMVWLRDGLQLPNSNTSNIRVFTSPSASFLEVTPESQNDFGSYNCTASNEIGTESKEFILIQADVPSVPLVELVEPYSSTVQVHFLEPESSGGVPILRYRAEWRVRNRGKWFQRLYEVKGDQNIITITGLKPETQYEVKMSAINGKGEGESSLPMNFKTDPVRYSYTNGMFNFFSKSSEGEPNAPKLEGIMQPANVFMVKWVRQDDGGSPITHYLVRYKPKEATEWKQEIRMPGGSEYILLNGLDWDTEYDVIVVAENMQGKSKPATLNFRTASEPEASPDSLDSGFGLTTGVIVGILVVVFVLLLVAVDVVCYFCNKCGLLMCIAVNFCGKPGPGSKGKDIEQGKAAYIKDECNQPIVEMRTEEETTTNHDVGGHLEPSETTPLTEPERVADNVTRGLDLPLSVNTNSETFDHSQSPTSESTTLTSSTTAPPPDPVPTTAPPILAPNTVSQAPLVDLDDGRAAEAEAAPAPPTASATAPIPVLTNHTDPPAEVEPAPADSINQPLDSPVLTHPEESHSPALHLPQDELQLLSTTASTAPSDPAVSKKSLAQEQIQLEDMELNTDLSAANHAVSANSTENKA
ncbi:neural cell adhesion molecule 1b isoform X8 [Denticeps clupeoides]|uniref:neural cell adhesion molecule 1b isoform X8 n=1 Tax=Denticeps clupeoides TaxID=299321 RepID=UPI0010A2E999|nr:neural cell adhesion molecule 1-like isoform X8 [Denticeps clupeoides]